MPLFLCSSFRIQEKNNIKQKQVTHHKIESTIDILDNFYKKNCNRRQANRPWIFWQLKSVNEQHGGLRRPSVKALTSSLTNSLCFNIHPFVFKGKTIFKQKQLTHHKIESRIDILDNYYKKNCNRRRANWPWIFWQ